MRRICSGCKKFLGEKEPLDDKRITHGLCQTCVEKIEKQLAALMEPRPRASGLEAR